MTGGGWESTGRPCPQGCTFLSPPLGPQLCEFRAQEVTQGPDWDVHLLATQAVLGG